MKIHYFILSMIISLNLGIGKTKPGNKSHKNIEKFYLSAFPVVTHSPDSIDILTYLKIPYYALQFVKSDSGFSAGYQANLALKTKSTSQLIGRKIWADSIWVKDYQETLAMSDYITLFKRYQVTPDEYEVIGQVIDNETRQSGDYNGQWNLSKYSGEFVLFPAVALVEEEGSWGFEPGFFPAYNHTINETDSGLTFFISGRVEGTYNLLIELKSKEDEILWSWKYDESSSDRNTFEKYIEIPSDSMNGISYIFHAELINSSGEKKSEEYSFTIRKPGIPRLVDDVYEALDQMNYILTKEERKRIKSSSRKNREEIFLELWESRDPTPGTVQNELMNEYYKRVAFANAQFSGFQEGWLSDMGMIYILFGPPNDVERSTSNFDQYTYEIWHYYNINQKLIFIDTNGFGDYRLNTPLGGIVRNW